MFSTLPKTSFDFLFKLIVSSAIDFNLDMSKILSFGKKLKTLDEKEKMQVTHIFFLFSTMFSILFRKQIHCLSQINFTLCKFFPFGQVKTLKDPFITIVAYMASADQDQTKQNMQSGL